MITVLQQVLNPTGAGGVSSEYRSLLKSSLLENKYVFIPMILNKCHRGINLQDIWFYYQEIKKNNADIIHIRGAAIDGLNAEIAARLCRKGRILVTVHGMYSDLVFISKIKRWLCRNIIERAVFSLADGISCVCQSATDRDYFNKWRSKMLPFVYNRIPVYPSLSRKSVSKIRQEIGVNDDDIIGLFVGRMTKEKGLDTVLESFTLLSDAWPNNLKFVFVGDGSYKEAFQNHACRLTQNVICLGEKTDVENYYLAADFLIQPSLHENHSVSLLEACAAKLPIIATSVGGNPEIVENDVTGILIPPNSAEQLTQAIKRVLDPKYRQNIKERICTYDFSKFSDANVDRQLDSVYTQILAHE